MFVHNLGHFAPQGFRLLEGCEAMRCKKDIDPVRDLDEDVQTMHDSPIRIGIITSTFSCTYECILLFSVCCEAFTSCESIAKSYNNLLIKRFLKQSSLFTTHMDLIHRNATIHQIHASVKHFPVSFWLSLSSHALILSPYFSTRHDAPAAALLQKTFSYIPTGHESNISATVASSSSLLNDLLEQQTDEPKFMPGRVAVCINCGILSEDLNRCERCKTRLQNSVRTLPAVSATTNQTANMGAGRDVVTVNPLTKQVCSRKTSSDDLGYVSDSQPPIKRIKIVDIKREVDPGKSWDQIKQEGGTYEDPGKSWDQIKQEINSNATETSSASSNSWHRPHTMENTLLDSKPVNIKEEPSSPLLIKKEVVGKSDAILPATLVKILLVNFNMRDSKQNLLTCNNFKPVALDKVIEDNQHLFRVTDSEVILEPNMTLCGGHSGSVGCNSRATCASLHICPSFIEGNCSDELCVYGHSFNTNHNKGILKRNFLENVDPSLLCKLLKSVVNALDSKDLLDICQNYNNRLFNNGCTNQTCNNLHLCFNSVIGNFKCGRMNCSLNHNILNENCKELLLKADIDTNEAPRDVIAALLALNPSISKKNLSLEYDLIG
ncbi:unnamed protein product, partial [Meganyctiphanes norvegica]